MKKLLDDINTIEIKNLSTEELIQLSSEIRNFLIEKVSNTGGHLASNLGVVELTISLHKVFSTPNDKIIWDVGHQSYVHKILTGRKDKFDNLRKMNGLSGFPKTNESEHDSFNTGHSSTSISAALGMAKARDILGNDNSVIAVIGDGALTGGMAFEALNDAGRSPNNIIVILNDNEMSISKNVGGLSKYLSGIRSQPFYFKVKEDIDFVLNKIPAIGKSAVKALGRAKGSIKYLIMAGVIFEELGFKYYGPIDGHNINDICKVLKRAKKIKGPVFIHVCTQKGKGYHHAETKPHKYHGVSPFEIETGEAKINGGNNYSLVFGEKLVEIANKNSKIVAITAAMPQGTGLDKFQKELPERFFDVGIAEQHAVTFAAGLAISGLKPFFAVYSSFLQRAYDQVVHDVSIQKLNVVFCIDRSGIVGDDGETHQGVYDISFLRHIPNMNILAPVDYSELRSMLEFAAYNDIGPIAIRYPRGSGKEELVPFTEVKYGKSVIINEGTDATFVVVGNMMEIALKACDLLKEKNISIELINARFVKPLDKDTILNSVKKTGKVVTLEDNTILGGFGSYVLEELNQNNVKCDNILMGFPDEFITHGTKAELYKKYELDSESIASRIIDFVGR